MPKGVFIQDAKVMERFRTVVQDALPYSLKINKNISKLAQLILSTTHNSVSISTLKRLFLYPDATNPSLFTLDSICKTIGYGGWNEFMEKENQIASFKHLEILTTLRLNGYSNFEEFKNILSEFSASSHKYEIVLTLVKVAVQKDDVETLSKLFELPFFLENINYEPPQFYFAQDLGLILRESPKIRELVKYYARSVVAQEWYIERFVDEDNLNGYYGEMMELYHQYKTNLEAQLFYHCLMCVRDIQNGIYKSEHFDFLIHFRENEPVHFMPKLRRLAILMVYFNDNIEIKDSLLEEIPFLIKDIDLGDRSYIALILSHIIFYKKDHYILKLTIECLNLSQGNPQQNIHLYRNYNILKIYEAFVLLGEGKPNDAKAKLASYNPMYQCPYRQNLYNSHYEIVNAMINN
ncbi:MAG: hypothetical protein PHR83_05220 [Paludibacter sp.]|nr:hypothetical protein [Paludibacter sp.]